MKTQKSEMVYVKILVVEDEKDMNRLIVKTLKKVGYIVDGCFDGEEALLNIMGTEYDAIILDVMMPKKNGYELIKELRGKNNDTPVLFLTAKDSVADKVKGLDLGGDDYLIKPFDFDELLARIRAITRKRVGNRSNIFVYGGLVMDVEKRIVTREGKEIQLLPKEFSILEYLIRNKEIIISREKIEDNIWNYEYSGNSNNVDVYMSKLRKKVDDNYDKKLIHTIRGVGWVLREESNKEDIGSSL